MENAHVCLINATAQASQPKSVAGKFQFKVTKAAAILNGSFDDPIPSDVTQQEPVEKTSPVIQPLSIKEIPVNRPISSAGVFQLNDSGYVPEIEPFGRPQKVVSPKKTVHKPKIEIDPTIPDDIKSDLNNEAFQTNNISESTTEAHLNYLKQQKQLLRFFLSNSDQLFQRHSRIQ